MIRASSFTSRSPTACIAERARSGSPAPLITGGVTLVDGKSLRGPNISAGVTFKGRTASIDFVHLREAVVLKHGRNFSLDVSARAELDFADLNGVSLSVFPAGQVDVMVPADSDCLSGVEFFTGLPGILPSRRIKEFGVNGSVLSRRFTLSLPSANTVDPPEVFPFCRESPDRRKTLGLQISPAFVP